MPRVTRSQTAAMLNAGTTDATKEREPFEEVNGNVRPKPAAKRVTRARSKAGTRKENYDNEEEAIPQESEEKVKPVVTTEPAVRRTRRQTAAAVVAQAQQQMEQTEADKSPAPSTRGRRAARDNVDSPSKIPSPCKKRPSIQKDTFIPPSLNASPSLSRLASPARPGVGRSQDSSMPGLPNETLPLATSTPQAGQPNSPVSKPLTFSALHKPDMSVGTPEPKNPSPLRITRSIGRSGKTVVVEGPATVKVKPLVISSPIARRIAAVEKSQSTPVGGSKNSLPGTTRVVSTIKKSITAHLPNTPPSKAAVTSKATSVSPSKAPSTPAGLKVRNPILGSPFNVVSSPQKVSAKMPPATAKLGSFASPTKAQLSRRPLANPDVGLAKAPTRVPAMVRPKVVVPVLNKKAPVIATTRAALFRTQKAAGQPIEEIGGPISTTEGMEVPVLPRPQEAVQRPDPSKPAVVVRPKLGVQPRKPVTQPPSKPTERGASTRIMPKIQAKTALETTSSAVPRPTLRLAAANTSENTKAAAFQSTKRTITETKIRGSVAPIISATRPNCDGPKLSQKKSIPTLPRVATIPAKAPTATSILPKPKVDDSKPKENVAPKVTKTIPGKRPFVPLKSTKPLTVPVPFKYDRPIRTERQPRDQPKVIARPTTKVIPDAKIKRTDVPRPRPAPAPVKDARTMLREMKRDARKGILPKLEGEVVYAELPSLSTETTASEPVAPALIVAGPPSPVSSTPIVRKTHTVEVVKPAPTFEVVNISGNEPLTPGRMVPYEEYESMKLAKERAEACARGNQAVAEWSSGQLTKCQSELAKLRLQTGNF